MIIAADEGNDNDQKSQTVKKTIPKTAVLAPYARRMLAYDTPGAPFLA
jgi:hypothetical protein